MPFLIAFFLWFSLFSQGNAQCVGTDLIDALSAETRAHLQDRAATHPFAEGNFWRATRDGQTIDMIGTYHLADPRHDPSLEHATTLLAEAGTLLVEAGPDEMARITQAVTSRPGFMFILDGPTLPELLSPSDWAAVSQAAAARGVPGFLAAKMRPWYIATLLSVPGCAMDAMRKEGALGLDQRVIALAQQSALPIVALEPFDTLFTIFSSLSAEQELEMVRGFLAMESRPEDLMITLANAYFRGETRLIWEFTLFEAMNTPGFDKQKTETLFALMEDVLMTRRNKAWIPVLEQAAVDNGRILAAFGALHLPGETGVLALLRDRGWQITPNPPGP
jgi:uncharacterized protein YbaP (TraB family)